MNETARYSPTKLWHYPARGRTLQISHPDGEAANQSACPAGWRVAIAISRVGYPAVLISAKLLNFDHASGDGKETRRRSEGDSNRWSPVERDGVFETTLIDLRFLLLPENQATPREGDREFESPFLRRRVLFRR